MLKFNQLSLRRGNRELLQAVSGIVHAGQRVGVTGANGVGKSSLFALIRGELQPDAGDFFLPPQTVIAHVAQETPAVDKPALEYVIDGDMPLRQLQQQIELARQHDDHDALARYYGELEAMDGYTAPSRAGKLMHGLGFSAAQEQTPVREFSGGWRMRLNLAQALMCRSDLLLLDEPTNHLDLEAVIWLEDWLRAYPGTLMLISHDRDFLDRTVTHIAHIENGAMTLYKGDYSDFEVHRAQSLASQQAAYEKQQRQVAHMRKFIDRFRAKASKARQAQSRVKALEKMTLISAAQVDSPFSFEFKPPVRLPDLLLSMEKVNAGYGATMVLQNLNLNLHHGDRIGLLGYNGAGKSTLIKLLAGNLAPLSGERVTAKDLGIGYFAQHQLEQLDGQASPLLHLQRLDPGASEKQLRGFLGGFAFRDEMATSPVAPLSGGEKARLVLAMIVYQAPALLLLDEPTNHLDLQMRHALATALQSFDGAMVVVSHDRHLLRTVTDRLLVVEGGGVREFDGDVDDYRRWVKEQDRETAAGENDAKAAATGKKQQRQAAAELRLKTQPLRNKVKKLEKEMEPLSQQLEQLQQQLADNELYQEQNKDKLKQLLETRARYESRLQQLEQAWMDAHEALEAMESGT